MHEHYAPHDTPRPILLTGRTTPSTSDKIIAAAVTLATLVVPVLLIWLVATFG